LRDGVVRISTCEGYWSLERLSPASTRVIYWLYTDPGGSIPAWIANKANKTSVPDLMRAVPRALAQPEWQRD